jgi:hypothetical protein
MTTELAQTESSFDDFILPSQCVARSKSSGSRCSKTAIPGGTVCRYHGGAAPQVRAAAANRLAVARDMALERLIEQLEPPESDLYRVEVKDLLAVVDKLTSKVQLLTGEATERREESKIGEVRIRLENELDKLRARSLGGIDADSSDIIDVEEVQ